MKNSYSYQVYKFKNIPLHMVRISTYYANGAYVFNNSKDAIEKIVEEKKFAKSINVELEYDYDNDLDTYYMIYSSMDCMYSSLNNRQVYGY